MPNFYLMRAHNINDLPTLGPLANISRDDVSAAVVVRPNDSGQAFHVIANGEVYGSWAQFDRALISAANAAADNIDERRMTPADILFVDDNNNVKWLPVVIHFLVDAMAFEIYRNNNGIEGLPLESHETAIRNVLSAYKV